MRLKNNNRKYEQGVAIVFAVLFAAFLLSIALALSAIFIPKLRTSGESKRSIGAIYAAESAVEWCLYVTISGNQISAPTMSLPGASFTPTDSVACAANPLRTTGTYTGVTRAYEISF